MFISMLAGTYSGSLTVTCTSTTALCPALKKITVSGTASVQEGCSETDTTVVAVSCQCCASGTSYAREYAPSADAKCFKDAGVTCSSSANWGFYNQGPTSNSGSGDENGFAILQAGGGNNCYKGYEVGKVSMTCSDNTLQFSIYNYPDSVITGQHYYVSCLSGPTSCTPNNFLPKAINNDLPTSCTNCGGSLPSPQTTTVDGQKVTTFSVTLNSANTNCDCNTAWWVVHQSGTYKGDFCGTSVPVSSGATRRLARRLN